VFRQLINGNIMYNQVSLLILLLLQGQAGEVGTLKQSNDLSDIGEHWPEKMLSH
jgi:hypothetical protein